MRESQKYSNRNSGCKELGNNCPMCGAWGHRLFRAHGYWIRECSGCDHRWAEHRPSEDHVDRIYNDSYFFGGGAGYPDYTQEGPLLVEHGRRYAELISKHLDPGTVLDVGSAAGFILQGFLESGWTGSGIEPNETMAAYARNQLGLKIFGSALEEYRTDEQFDLVTMIQVLPHFVHPKQALEIAARLIKPGGHLLIETWNFRSWTSRVWGRHWHEYSPPSVLHWFSDQSLRRFTEENEFGEIATGHPKKVISGAHIKSLLRHKTTALALRPVRLLVTIIPRSLKVPYPAEDLFWVLFQKKG